MLSPRLKTSEGGGVYAENVEALRLIQRGFSLRRTDSKLPDLYINLVNYDEFKADEQIKGAKNIFKFVNQFAIDGEHHRIPDGIVFVNGLLLLSWSSRTP